MYRDSFVLGDVTFSAVNYTIVCIKGLMTFLSRIELGKAERYDTGRKN